MAPPSSRSRTRPALAIATLLVLGPLARARLDGAIANLLGVALWTMTVYALAWLVRPRAEPARLAAFAASFGVAVELAQLTPYPLALAERIPLAHVVFGAYFDPWDLPAYALGAAFAGLGHHLIDRPRAARRSAPRGSAPPPPENPRDDR